MTALQVREGLLDPYFHQWLRDTEELLEQLPRGLEAPEQSLGLPLTFERWLLQLKVCPALQTLITAMLTQLNHSSGRSLAICNLVKNFV